MALKQQISALEQRIAALEAEPASPPVIPRLRDRLASGLLLLIAVALAAIPPALVTLDRWLGNRQISGRLQSWWCMVAALCQSVYPPYFAVILPALVACAIVVWFLSRRLPAAWSVLPSEASRSADRSPVPRAQSAIAWCLIVAATVSTGWLAWRAVQLHIIPGWEFALAYLLFLLGWTLRETPGNAMRWAWRRRSVPFTGTALVGLALLLVMASLYSAPHFNWITALALLLAGVHLWRSRRTVSPILGIALLALGLFAANTNAWWLSAIGDEYTFWAYARGIAQEQPLSVIASNIFTGQAVYGAHPYLSSLIQAVFVKIFGGTGFGWRVSNACLSAGAIVLCYIFFRAFVQRRTALMAALFLAVSHYIMSFGKIGYNNLQALFAEGAVLATAAWAVRTQRSMAFALLGAAMGFGFYVYPAALYVLPLPLLLLLFYAPPISWRACGQWALLTVSLAIPVSPLLLQPGYWQAKMAGTLWYNPELTRTVAGAATNIARNLVYSALSFLYVPQEDHYIAVAYVDPLTAALVILGLAAFLYLAFRRKRFAWFMLLAFVAMLLTVGASHDRPYPTGTRMFLLLPWFALFAATGLTWILAQLRRVGLCCWNGVGLSSLIFLVALGLNLFQAYPLARDRMAAFQSPETLTLRLMQIAQREERTAPKTYVFITDPTWTSVGFRVFPEVYPIQAKFAEVVVTEPVLPESARPILADSNALVIIKPWLDPAWQQALEPELRGLGKVPCPIRATNGDQRFVLWHRPGLEWLCGEPSP